MIITAIITFVVGIVAWIISFLPELRIDFSPQAQDSLFSVISGVGCLVPVNTAGIIIGLIVLAYGIEFLWYVFNWLIAKIPFIE